MPGRPYRALLGLALVLAALGCRGKDPAHPIAGHRELCCKSANADSVSFVGCRTTSYCRAGETVWVRGPVACTSTTEAGCAGGRCCELDVPPLPDSETETETETEAEAEPTPEPAKIVPVPLDWEARPTPVAIPKLACPVAGTVLLHVEVDAGGRVTEAAVRRSLDPECDEIAQDALLHAEFEPALTPAGEPIPSSLAWTYTFAAAGDPR